MKESYPYIVLPQKVEKIKSDGIPLPPLPQLLPLPEKVKHKFIGLIIFTVSLLIFIVLCFNLKSQTMYYTLIAFFITLISMVATIFEFIQYGKLKKQYEQDLKLYNENKEAFRKIKLNQEKIIQNNKNLDLVKNYQLEKTLEFFSNSFDTINAIHNEYSLAKKRFKLFLEEYFPDEVLDNVRINHSSKNLEYVPDFVIKFAKPKLNLAVEIEEPYSLSTIPENIQKDYEAKERIRQRFANELCWLVIVFSEEQAVKNPIECCKFIEDSMEFVFGEMKAAGQFANIPPIKKTKMLTGAERAHMRTTGYREKYLMEAGLLDHSGSKADKYDETKIEEEKKAISEIIKEHASKLQEEDIKNESIYSENDMKNPDEKKELIENEQMRLIKKVAQKLKPETEEETIKSIEPETIKFKVEAVKEIQETKVDEQQEKDMTFKKEVKQETLEMEEVVIKETVNGGSKNGNGIKGEQIRKEDDILNDLYKALDKHSRKQQERKEKRLREQLDGINETKEKKENENIGTPVINTVSEETITVSTEQKVEETPTIKEQESLPEIPDLTGIEEKETKQEEIKQEEETLTEELQKIDIPIVTEHPIEEINEENNEQIKELEKTEETTVETLEMENKAEKFRTQLLSEESAKNQEIIEHYREKIEGAVFDKSWDELIQLCNDAIKIVPFWDWAYYRRSTAWGNKKEFEKVIEDCTKAIGYNPALSDAYYNRGTARYFTGRYREAADDYQKAIDLNYIKRAEAYFNRGLCFQKMDYHKKAYLEFMKAKEMGSKKAEDVLRNQYD